MRTSFVLAFGLLTGITECATTKLNRFSVPVRRQGSLRRRDGNEAVATKDVVVDFTVGGQPIPLALDSGSTFTYVASTQDTNRAETSILPVLFNPNTSSTYHDENNPDDAMNCGGKATLCVLGVDDVATDGLTAHNMTFGVASHVEPGVFSSGQAGTMGMGRQADDPSTWSLRDRTFWLRAGTDLEAPYLFTVDIYQDRNGTWDFGYIDPAKYTGEITYASMDTSVSNWNFNMTAFTIGNGTSQTVDTFRGVVDTGGPNIGLPSYIAKPYFESFGGTPSPGNSHDYPCSAYPPPDLTLATHDGGKLVLNGSLLVEPPDGSSKTCHGRLDDSEQTAYNLGASLLDQKFVIFDHANARLGFADKRRDGQPQGVQPSGTTSSSSTSTPATPTGTITSATSTGTGGSSSGGSRTPETTGLSELLICMLCASFVYSSL